MQNRSTPPAGTLVAEERNPLLRPPVLFTHGPWVILAASLVVAVGVLLAGQSRQVESRKAEYQKGLATARAAAIGAAEYFGALRERLARTATQVGALQGALDSGEGAARLVDVLADAAGAQDPTPFVVGPDGMAQSRAATTERAQRVAAKAAQALASVPNRALGEHTVMNLQGGAVLAHRVKGNAHAQWVLLVLEREAALRAVERIVGPWEGHLRVRDTAGRTLIEAVRGRDGYAMAPGGTYASKAAVSNIADALRAPLDFTSERLLEQSAPLPQHDIVATFGLRESSALAEFRGRYYASWRIIGVALGAWMVLCVFVVWALVRFKRTEAYLRRLATTDVLTGLPNRRSFHHLLEAAFHRRAVASNAALALYFLDIDNFKEVNDTAGHPTGDALLRHVAVLLNSAVRPGDQVCRLAGDEFTILAPGVRTLQEAQALGERVLARLNSTFVHEGATFKLQGSLGVALYPLHAAAPQELMQFADTALYRAKAAGMGCCVTYAPDMTAYDRHRAQTLRDLEAALSRDDELFLAYQPKYHLATGSLAGHEALLRWQHPTRGLVPPAEFIKLAEDAGLVGSLGKWVLRRAVRQIRAWHDQGLGWHSVAVNISALQLADRALVGDVAAALSEFRVRGALLQVEVTESTLAASQHAAAARLRELRGLGVAIAVDDFGTGFSCLSMLSDFEIDYLKVDRSFVSRVHLGNGRNICQAIVALGQSIGASVVAEGVETPEQAQALAEMGCNEVQGYLFAKPQSPAVAPTMLTARAYLPLEGAAALTGNAETQELPCPTD